MANRSSPGFIRQSSVNSNSRMLHFKLVLLGEASVGKSSLVLRFVKDQFRDALESTVGGKLTPAKEYQFISKSVFIINNVLYLL